MMCWNAIFSSADEFDLLAYDFELVKPHEKKSQDLTGLFTFPRLKILRLNASETSLSGHCLVTCVTCDTILLFFEVLLFQMVSNKFLYHVKK